MSLTIANSSLNAYFCIREGTKDEYLTAAPDGRVVRWAAEKLGGVPSDRQKWFISVFAVYDEGTKIVKETRYRIQNLETKGFLHLGAQGTFAWYWCDVKESNAAESTFAFEMTGRAWPDRYRVGPWDKYVNIREFTKNEYLGVGDNGWLIRWGRTGDNSQTFYLERAQSIVNSLPVAAEVKGVVNEIPGPSGLNGLDDIPANSQEILVGEEILPSAVIRDHRYSDPLTQAQDSPYYKLQHFQSYGLPEEGYPAAVTLPAGTVSEIRSQFRTLFRRQELETLEETFMWQLSGEFTGSFTAKKGAEDASKSGSGTAKLAFTVGKSVTHLKSDSSNYEKESIFLSSFTFDTKAKPARIAIFVLLDRYVLTDSRGRLVDAWRVFDNSSMIIERFPKE